MKNKSTFLYLANFTLILLIIFLFTKLGYVFKPLTNIIKILLTPIIIAFFLYYVLRPVVRLFDRSKLHKGLIVLLTILLFLLSFLFIFAYGGNAIKNQFENSFMINFSDITNYTNELNNSLSSKLSGFNLNFDFTNKLLEGFKNLVLNFTSNLSDIFSTVGSIGTQLILTPFILFYLLKDDILFSKKLISITPIAYRGYIKNMLNKIDTILSIYISGQLLVAVVLGVLMFIGFLLIGLPNALLLGFFTMITSIIPFLGAFLACVPAVLIALPYGWGMVIKVILTATIVQQLEGNLITPNIMGNRLNLHPLAVIFIILICVNLFGIMGAFIAVPLYLIIVIITKTILQIAHLKNMK